LDSSWSGITVDQLRFELSQGGAAIVPPATRPETPGPLMAPGAQLLVLLDDGLAGVSVHVLATARAAGQDLATTTADALPLLHSERTVELVFAAAPSPPPQVIGVDCAPPNVNLRGEQNQQLQVTARYSNGSTALVTAAASFTSSDAMVAGVSPTGQVTGHRRGDARVTGSVAGFDGICAIHVN
jgi:hypothetical protein